MGIKLSKNSIKVLKRRYLRKDDKGVCIETPEDMFRRVAKNIASADLIYDDKIDILIIEEKFYDMMTSLKFLPNSPTLMNAGRKLQQLSACFVLPIEDSIESIFDAVKNTALIHKSGGGTGFDFSKLRPINNRVASTNGVSSGPISFMKVFDSVTNVIKQGGTRRGANMGILRCDHPDILNFITCKIDDKSINNFNISVAITEKFMVALTENKMYDLVDPHTDKVIGQLLASTVFDLIVSSAWKNGEPGIIFIDRINNDNPTPHIGSIESVNPCGEQPLLAYESCNLGSINLSKFVKNEKIDYQELKYIVHMAVHFLDNVIDMNKYPLTNIEVMTKRNRKLGLGVMGFADMLILLGISYDSEKAVKIAEKLMFFISKESFNASVILAQKRGSFPNFKESIYAKKIGCIRNATTTTIAPTGTISIIANCSSGIEPLYAISYIRTVMDNDRLVEVHRLFKKFAVELNFYSETLMKEIALKGSLKEVKKIPNYIKKLFLTSHEILPERHIDIQAIFQKYTDNAVSKTVNFDNGATCDDVSKVYIRAYKMGCKGVTIYRDGSRQEQVLMVEKVKDVNVQDNLLNIIPQLRPERMNGHTQKMYTGCGNLYVTINESEDGSPFEVFTQMGKAGGCFGAQLETIARLISLALRLDIKIDIIVKQLLGISCHMPSWNNGKKTLSCSDAIAKAFSMYIDIMSVKKMDKTLVSACPNCYGVLEQIEGCSICRGCGYSKCS